MLFVPLAVGIPESVAVPFPVEVSVSQSGLVVASIVNVEPKLPVTETL